MRGFLRASVAVLSLVCLVALCTASIVAVAQGHISPGRGSGGGVQLQPSSPGTMQTGNINLSGNVCLNCTDATHGVRIAPAQNNGVNFFAQGAPTQPGQPFANWNDGTGRAITFMRFQDISLGIAGPDGPGTTIGSASGATSLHLEGQPQSTGTIPNVIVSTPFGVTMTGGPILRGDNPRGTQKFAFAFDGTPTFASPVPITSGGTGTASNVACPAGQFLTSNGTAYSCAALPAGSAIVSVTITNSTISVAGSSCTSGVATVAPANVTVGMGCLMNYVGQISTACGGSTCPTFHCSTFAGTGVNAGQTMYEPRYCNTGTNVETAPAGSYALHFLPP